MKWTIRKFREAKKAETPLACVTAYDYITGKMVDRAGVALVLVGDSLTNTALGHPNTVCATLESMVHHTNAVARAVQNAIVVADMPFMTYFNEETALRSAARFLQEGLAQAVKLEGGVSHAHIIRALVQNGVPVMAHIGLQPQHVHARGYAVRGRTEEDRAALIADLDAVVAAGAFSVVLECVTAETAAYLTERSPVPTIGIGAGTSCDGQILVLADLLGLTEESGPKFSKRYVSLFEESVQALQTYVSEVQTRAFPDASRSFSETPPKA